LPLAPPALSRIVGRDLDLQVLVGSGLVAIVLVVLSRFAYFLNCVDIVLIASILSACLGIMTLPQTPAIRRSNAEQAFFVGREGS
jgi:hypothetical protein